MGFEITMCSEGLAYMSGTSVFSMQLDGLEVMDVVWEPMSKRRATNVKPQRLTGVEEHVSNCSRLLVHFKGMACQDDAFRDYPSGVRIQESPSRHELWS